MTSRDRLPFAYIRILRHTCAQPAAAAASNSAHTLKAALGGCLALARTAATATTKYQKFIPRVFVFIIQKYILATTADAQIPTHNAAEPQRERHFRTISMAGRVRVRAREKESTRDVVTQMRQQPRQQQTLDEWISNARSRLGLSLCTQTRSMSERFVCVRVTLPFYFKYRTRFDGIKRFSGIGVKWKILEFLALLARLLALGSESWEQKSIVSINWKRMIITTC